MTLRFKMSTIVVAVIVVANSLLSYVLLQYLGRVWLREVQTRVNRNLNAAGAAYQDRVNLIESMLFAVSRQPSLAAAVQKSDAAGQGAFIDPLVEAKRMDFLVLLDGAGRVVRRAGRAEKSDDLSRDLIVARAMRQRQTASGTVVFSRERLLAEGPELAELARIDLRRDDGSVADEPICTDGLMIAAAVPVLDAEGRIAAMLYGGTLLNRRFEIVDAIKGQVFPSDVYRGKDIGTVTIFLRDIRIATNVVLENGARAIGTRLSDSVREAVLQRGEKWSAPALVIDDWYITAYEPIRDVEGNAAGVLYAGLLQAPFTHQRNVISVIFLSIIGAATIGSLVLLSAATQLVLSPIRQVVDMAHKVIGGDLTARLNVRPPGEMGVLCRAIDSMAQAISEREEMIQQAARQQVDRSEQLASVGRLAAGVAHEINNPLTGVLAFADMLREKENMDDQDREDLDLIIRETKRAREIVKGLLEYAREAPHVRTDVDLNELVRHTLRLLGNREAFQNIYIVDDLADTLPPVHGDKNKLEQVLVNLCINACEAMLDGGTLMVTTALEKKRVVVKVTDTGCGIKKAHLDKIFEPFFTTKPVGKGTGLGLSVTYGIVQQHGGTLEVESDEGKGTTFTIRLPTADAM